MENDDKYLPELLAEKDSLDSSFTHAMKLLNAGKELFCWRMYYALTRVQRKQKSNQLLADVRVFRTRRELG